MKKLFYIAFSALIIALPNNKNYCQELDAHVTINMDRLEYEARTNVSTMKGDLERYLNNQRFTKIEWNGPKIPLEITIYLTGGSNNRYSGKLYMISKRYLDGPGDRQSMATKFFDEKWDFEYARGANLSYNPLIFDPFRSLIDFYSLLAVGYDLDTYTELEGTPIFEIAKNLVLLGSSQNVDGYQTYSQQGDLTRYNLVSELTDIRLEPFRKLIF